MKNKEEILKSTPVFLNNFSDQDDVFREFEVPEAKSIKYKILFASYGSEGYEGDAYVLYAVGDELFETSGSHCSCYGLEGQWSDEEMVVLEELKNRLEKGSFGEDSYSGNNFNSELKQFLGL